MFHLCCLNSSTRLDMSSIPTTAVESSPVIRSPENLTLQIEDQKHISSDEELASQDFTFLNLDEPALIKILSYLNNADRLSAAKTCTYLRSVALETGSLWRELTMDLGWRLHGLTREFVRLQMNEIEKESIEVSIGKVRNVRISFNKNFQYLSFDQDSFNLLNAASETWCLEKFSFISTHANCENCEGNLYICFENVYMPYAMRTFLNNCLFRNPENLTHLEICTMYRERRIAMMILDKSMFFPNIQKFFLDFTIGTRILNVIMLNTAYLDKVAEKVLNFKNLQFLAINSLYLTERLIRGLSNLVKLQILKISGCNFDASISSWPKLCDSLPSLRVEMHSPICFNSENIHVTLPPSAPISSWFSKNAFNCFAAVDRRWLFKQLLAKLPLYAETLEDLYLPYLRHDDFDNEIEYLCIKCSKLRRFVYSGLIGSHVVLKLAALPRYWDVLYFESDKIRFPENWEESRETQMAKFCNEMSDLLGYQWCPSMYSSAQQSCSRFRPDQCKPLSIHVDPI